MFKYLDVSLLYITMYHSQINSQSKCTNQIMKIALQFYLNIMTKATEWLKSLFFIQFNLNNTRNVTSKIFNKTVYDFSSNTVFILNTESILSILTAWIEVSDIIDFVKINIKYHYNWWHQSLAMRIDDYVLLQLHCKYFTLTITNKKLSQQYVKFFWIIDKID